MTASRPVLRVVDAPRQLEGEGFEVRRPFPSGALAMVDPFLLLDEMGPKDTDPGGAIGTGDHPHRGSARGRVNGAGSSYGRERECDHERAQSHRECCQRIAVAAQLSRSKQLNVLSRTTMHWIFGSGTSNVCPSGFVTKPA